jgi:hypothetical protein
MRADSGDVRFKRPGELQIRTHNIVTLSGMGCSSNLLGYLNTYGMALDADALHGCRGIARAGSDAAGSDFVNAGEVGGRE